MNQNQTQDILLIPKEIICLQLLQDNKKNNRLNKIEWYNISQSYKIYKIALTYTNRSFINIQQIRQIKYLYDWHFTLNCKNVLFSV